MTGGGATGLPAPAANVLVEGLEVDILWADRRLVVMDDEPPDRGHRARRHPSWRVTRGLEAVVAEIRSA